MSDLELQSPPDEPMLLAGEYVLGVLDADQMQAVAMRALTDVTLANEIAAWQVQLAPLALLVPPVAAPASLWPRIAEAIGAQAVVAKPPPVRWTEPPTMPGAVRFWRGATVGALALAAALAFILILPRRPEPVTLATLAPIETAAAPAFIVRVLPDGSLRIAALAPRVVPTGRDLQLWALPPGAKQVVSMGLLPTTDGTTFKASKLTVPGGRLLVSLEPRGGSPTGQPTGPVLYGGTIRKL